jgi:hypothetical protein
MDLVGLSLAWGVYAFQGQAPADSTGLEPIKGRYRSSQELLFELGVLRNGLQTFVDFCFLIFMACDLLHFHFEGVQLDLPGLLRLRATGVLPF